MTKAMRRELRKKKGLLHYFEVSLSFNQDHVFYLGQRYSKFGAERVIQRLKDRIVCLEIAEMANEIKRKRSSLT